MLIVLAMMACVGCARSGSGSESSGESIPRWPPVSLLPDEAYARVGTCLEDKGYAPVVDPNDRSVGFPGNQPGASEALRACFEEVDPSYLEDPPPFTQEQLDDLYAYVTSQRDCYVEYGYPRVDMPSRDRFDTEMRGRFDPAGALAAMGDAPSPEEIHDCRERSRPLWFLG